MDSFEWNKIAGAVLGTTLFIMVVKIGTESVFYVPPPAQEGYHVEGVEEAAGGGGVAATPTEEPLPDFATAIPAANPMRGEEVAKRCAQCHTWNKGGPNKIGPNQWDLINRPIATEPGFDYSSAMKRFADKEKTWTYAHLYRYLRSPARVVPGTKMAFVGLPRSQDRLDLLAYMRSWADTPPPLPPPQPKAEAPSDNAASANASAGNDKGAATGGNSASAARAPAAEQSVPAK